MFDLTSVRAKLTRSQENAQAVKDEVRSWMDRHPYSLIEKASSDNTRYSLILHLNEPPPFQRWSLMIADAINNLRNALDHLVYAVACHEAAPNPPAKEGRLRFPITDCSANFDAEIAAGRLGTISEPIRTAIQAAQPYNRPHPTIPPLLSVLRDLNNRDKHKLLQMAYGTIVQGNIGFIGEFPQDGRQWKPVTFTGEIKDGTEIFAMVCDRPTPDMKFDRHIMDVVIAVRHGKRDPSAPDWTDRSDFAALLRDISKEVRRIVYEVADKVPPPPYSI